MSADEEGANVSSALQAESVVGGLEARALRWAWWIVIVAVSCLAVGLSFFRDDISAADGGIAWLLKASGATRLDLARENGLGAWWSGTLLLLAALHAMDGFAREVKRDAKTGRAWLLLAGILTALSLDEMGSLHERVSMFIPPYGVKANLPFFAVMIGVLTVSLRGLWQSGVYRRQVWLIATAFFLFATVILQEILENRTNWWGDADNAREALEEGSELVAMQLLLLATSTVSAGIFRPSERRSEPVFQSLETHATWLALFVLFAALPLACLTTFLPDIPKRGIPGNWLASASFFLASLATLRPSLQGRRSVLSGTSLIAGICLLLSVTALQPFLDDSGTKAAILLVGAVSVAILQITVYRISGWRQRLTNSVLICAPASLAVLHPGVVGVTLAFIVVGIVVVITTRNLGKRRDPPDGRASAYIKN